MKVKELNAGDWFTDNTHYWIRTEFNGEYYTLNMDNTCMFGSLGTIPENTEVNFVSSHEVVLPQNREKRLCTLRYAPVFEPLYDVNTNDVMVLRYLNDALHYVIISTIWEYEIGIWRPVEKPNDFVRLTSTFEYQVYEE